MATTVAEVPGLHVEFLAFETYLSIKRAALSSLAYSLDVPLP
jgi:hypothetical protein